MTLWLQQIPLITMTDFTIDSLFFLICSRPQSKLLLTAVVSLSAGPRLSLFLNSLLLIKLLTSRPG